MNKTATQIRLDVLIQHITMRQGYQSLLEAAEASGVSGPTLSRVMRGGMPNLETFVRLCVWLQEDPKEFFVEQNFVFASQNNTVTFGKQMP